MDEEQFDEPVPKQLNNIPSLCLPAELWEGVFAYLGKKDLKSANQVSATHWQMSKLYLWTHPQFRRRIDYGCLMDLAKHELPIKHLKLSQLIVEGCSHSEKFRMVDLLLDSFPLSSFKIDSGRLDVKELDYFTKLPVSCIDSVSFSINTPAEQYVDLLVSKNLHCPALIISDIFHSRLGLCDWRRLSSFPIIEINADIYDFPEQDFDHEFDFAEYDSIVSQITPTPRYIPIGRYITPEDLTKIRKIRITELNLKDIDQSIPISRYVQALKQNCQFPTISFSIYNVCMLRPEDLLLLCEFPIAYVHTKCLALTESTANQFVKIIIEKHCRCPINSMDIDRFQLKRELKEHHLEGFRAAGLKYRIC